MKLSENAGLQPNSEQTSEDGDELLGQLLDGSTSHTPALSCIVVGKLVATSEESPFVVFAGQPGSAALMARSIVDLHAAHVGKDVLLTFADGDLTKPIVVGVLRQELDWSGNPRPSNVRVDADDQRMVVTAQDQLVLRCGKASITLTKAGKVLIEGTYVCSHSSGVIRVKGGSVQLN